ncbi:MAG TPA: SRPBCC domain-containing protein [Longimicrobiales bacterium]|nr:SRPBCC domain-containing protein [Longimicrobiales bacterium]
MSPEGKADRHTLVVDYELPAAPEKVWRALTESDLLSRWLMPNDMRAEVGHAFTFRLEPAPDPGNGWDGVVHCEVLEVEPGRRLRYTWRSDSTEAATRLDTVVTWTLKALDDGGTRLRLEQSGFRPENGRAYAGVEAGWRGWLAQRLREVVEGL